MRMKYNTIKENFRIYNIIIYLSQYTRDKHEDNIADFLEIWEKREQVVIDIDFSDLIHILM